REHVAAERRTPRDARAQHRVHDGDRPTGTEGGTGAGRGGLLDARHGARGAEGGGEPRRPEPSHRSRLALANASGRSADSVQRRSLFGPTAITSRPNPNSASSCRHAPQGEAGASGSPATSVGADV